VGREDERRAGLPRRNGRGTADRVRTGEAAPDGPRRGPRPLVQLGVEVLSTSGPDRSRVRDGPPSAAVGSTAGQTSCGARGRGRPGASGLVWRRKTPRWHRSSGRGASGDRLDLDACNVHRGEGSNRPVDSASATTAVNAVTGPGPSTGRTVVSMPTVAMSTRARSMRARVATSGAQLTSDSVCPVRGDRQDRRRRTTRRLTPPGAGPRPTGPTLSRRTPRPPRPPGPLRRSRRCRHPRRPARWPARRGAGTGSAAPASR
jgi:hypothetical protein